MNKNETHKFRQVIRSLTVALYSTDLVVFLANNFEDCPTFNVHVGASASSTLSLATSFTFPSCATYGTPFHSILYADPHGLPIS